MDNFSVCKDEDAGFMFRSDGIYNLIRIKKITAYIVCMYVCHLFSVNLLQDVEIVTLLIKRNTAT
jgi:hypothetical protein